MRRTRSSSGFTLVELVVVIGIALLVFAITMPVAKSMISGNRAMTCATRLQGIGKAMKIYAMDHGSVPPLYPDLGAGVLVGPGLLALFDEGYINGETQLHCPADWTHERNDPLYAESYCRQDVDASTDGSTAYGAWNQYTYLSCRGVVEGSWATDEKRQLTPLSNTGSGFPSISRQWTPDDTTVVTWCSFHYTQIQEAGLGQYQVLFWDGSVQRLPAALLRDGIDVTEAWRVSPDDDPTP